MWQHLSCLAKEGRVVKSPVGPSPWKRPSAPRLCRGPTQLCTAVVCDDPGEDGVLGEVVGAAVRQVVEVEEILVVAEEAALPLQHVALRRVFRHVVL